jgi:hypothetical protein
VLRHIPRDRVGICTRLCEARIGGEVGVELVEEREGDFGDGEASFGGKIFSVVDEILKIVFSFYSGQLTFQNVNICEQSKTEKIRKDKKI